MQLAQAARPDQLIPGDPDQVSLLARMVAEFAEAAAEARRELQRSGLGGWTGAAAQAAETELNQLNDRLSRAEESFDEAGSALAAYARAHAQALDEATRAPALWKSAAPAAAILRGAAVGVVPPDAPTDPEAVLARAGAMAQDAHAYLVTAGRTLHRVLDEAKEGAPKDPGMFARLRRALASVGMGLVDGVVLEPIEGAIGVGKLAIALNPARAIYDPDGYVEAQEALYTGIGHILLHPQEFGARLIDVKGWEEDPFRTFGKFLPDLLAIGVAVRAGGLLKSAEGAERLATSKTVVESVGRDEVFDRVAPDTIRRVLRERGLDPDSVVGKAVRKDLSPPFGGVNPWEATRLEEGQLVAVVGNGKAIVPFEEGMTTDGQWFSEIHQLPGQREILDDGTVGPSSSTS
jgi:hypothetical protein